MPNKRMQSDYFTGHVSEMAAYAKHYGASKE